MTREQAEKEVGQYCHADTIMVPTKVWCCNLCNRQHKDLGAIYDHAVAHAKFLTLAEGQWWKWLRTFMESDHGHASQFSEERSGVIVKLSDEEGRFRALMERSTGEREWVSVSSLEAS